MCNQELKKLYQSTFSQIHSSTEIRWENMEPMKRTYRPVRSLVVLAAVVALLAALSTVAVAANLFGLRELLLPEKQVTMPVNPETGEREIQIVDVISLQGYAGTPENLAVAEWQSFLQGYDVFGAAQAADRNPEPLDACYDFYQVYNREMADKLDTIVEKYGLSLHTFWYDYLDQETLSQMVGGDFLGENRAYSSYMYEDGTFKFDGDGYISGYGKVDYQFMRCVRSSFTDVVLNISDVTQYREWTYETACGQAVTLALGPAKALLIADLGDSFVTLNVLAGTETAPDDIFSSGPISADDLEILADSFDFTVLTPVLEPGTMESESPEADMTSPAEDMFYSFTGMQEEAAQDFYCGFVRAIEEDQREDVAAMIIWPRTVTVPEGEFLIESAEDFLPYYDEIFTGELLEVIHENQYDEARADLITHDGMVGGASGAIWFALLEDGRVAVLTVENPQGWSIRYDGPAGVHPD